MTEVAVLGATGSVGRQALQVIAACPDLKVRSLAAGSRAAEFTHLVRQWRPVYAAMADPAALRAVEAACADLPTRFLAGEAGLCELAADPGAGVVLAAMVGSAGLAPVLAAARHGKRIALANKEALVTGGALVTRTVREGGATLLPVDSEHSAIWQCLWGEAPASVTGLTLTASGGPFRGWDKARLESVTPAQALAHPSWRMGPKITVDSATLMNKGLEVIEAHWLFALPPQAIEVVVHPQSIIHSLVTFADGSVKAQLGWPDMRLPIQLALTWPRRLPSPVAPIDLAAVGRLDFARPDKEAFPCLDLAYRALAIGPGAPAVLNAANEIAVAAFLKGALPFAGIGRLNSAVLEGCGAMEADTLAQVLEADAAGRRRAQELLSIYAGGPPL
ncbi:MAG: 1-deoxy-D-xylulose-5-phosphate reductoisomerase [Bacillota bacterium]